MKNYANKSNVIPIFPIIKNELEAWLKNQPSHLKNWVKTTKFTAEAGSINLVPDAKGNLSSVLLGIATEQDFWSYAALPNQLAAGSYQIVSTVKKKLDLDHLHRIYLAWVLGSYSFDYYRSKQNPLPQAQLLLPQELNSMELNSMLETIFHIRDLINIPAEDFGPKQLVEETAALAKQFRAKVKVISGEKLKQEYPAVHAVGQSSHRPPHFIELEWGNKKNPRVVLIGKGICFDTGGLNIKVSDGMRLMKKDMSGAAHALGLSQLIMANQLPVHLHLLIHAADNAVSSSSYRPGDVIRTRSGQTVEVTNTDAEGRLVLCDALTAAAEKNPDLIIDFSSLTGAARVALGPDIPAFFCNDELIASQLLNVSQQTIDPMWRLPLYAPYRDYLKSDIADFTNSASVAFAGAITAALFLQSFVKKDISWIHFDMFAWNLVAKPGRPVGGEVMTLRAVWQYLKERFS